MFIAGKSRFKHQKFVVIQGAFLRSEVLDLKCGNAFRFC